MTGTIVNVAAIGAGALVGRYMESESTRTYFAGRPDNRYRRRSNRTSGTLRVNSLVFWLHASVESIKSCIQSDLSRPALVSGKTFVEEIAEVLARREPLYMAAAHRGIDVNDTSPDQIAENIIKIWGT